MDTVAALAPGSGLIAAACTALGLSRASLHRRQAFRRQPLAPVRRRPAPMRALVAQERQVVLNLLREPRFVDQAKPMLMNPFFLDRLLEKAQCQSLTMELIRASNMAQRFKPQLRDGGHRRNPVHILGDFRADPCRRD